MWQDNVSLFREEKLDCIGIKSDHLTTMVVFLSLKENEIFGATEDKMTKNRHFFTVLFLFVSGAYAPFASLSLPEQGIGHMAKNLLTRACFSFHLPSLLFSAHTLSHTGKG